MKGKIDGRIPIHGHPLAAVGLVARVACIWTNRRDTGLL
jgi:hypothetical protein